MGKLKSDDIPLGFSMALAQNLDSASCFYNLAPDRQRDIIARARSVQSKAEMHSLVNSLSTEGV